MGIWPSFRIKLKLRSGILALVVSAMSACKLLAQYRPPLWVPPPVDYNPLYKGDPTAGKLVPPENYPEENLPKELEALKAAATKAQNRISGVEESAAQKLRDDPTWQSLNQKLKSAQDDLDQAQPGDERATAARAKLRANQTLALYVDGRVKSDPDVINARQSARDADAAVETWVKNHEYESVSDILAMVPGLNWLANFNADPDRYLWAEQWFKSVNEDIERNVNGHIGRMKIAVESAEDQSPLSLAYGNQSSNLVSAKAFDLGALHVQEGALLAKNRQIGDAPLVQGKIHAELKYEGGHCNLTLILIDSDMIQAGPIASAPGASSNMPTASPNNSWSGTGFFISADGLILTNRHVATDEDDPQESRTLKIVWNGQRQPVEVAAIDRQQDLALLRLHVNNPTPFLQVRSDMPGPGASCAILGYPGIAGAVSDNLKITQGIVTSFIDENADREPWATDGYDVLMDAKIDQGNSGGPILDHNGRVIAVAGAKVAGHGELADNYSLGISVTHLKRFLEAKKIEIGSTKNEAPELSDEVIYKNASPAVVRIEGSD